MGGVVGLRVVVSFSSRNEVRVALAVSVTFDSVSLETITLKTSGVSVVEFPGISRAKQKPVNRAQTAKRYRIILSSIP